MTGQIIDGKQIAAELRADLAIKIAARAVKPTLAVVLVGDDPASQVYVRSKIRLTEETGMISRAVFLPADTPQDTLDQTLIGLAKDEAVDGILLQLPLPKHLDTDAALAHIPAEKDVDGLTEASAGRLVLGQAGLRPCTPTGCVILARRALGEDLSGKHCVVIGRSILVGKPAALLFLEANCTVTIAHSRTPNIAQVCRQADILVPAVGRSHMVGADWVKPGAAIIDVGINRIPAPEKGVGKTRLVGDVDYEVVKNIAGHITPVPGGVGPMTIACLLQNTLKAAALRRGW